MKYFIYLNPYISGNYKNILMPVVLEFLCLSFLKLSLPSLLYFSAAWWATMGRYLSHFPLLPHINSDVQYQSLATAAHWPIYHSFGLQEKVTWPKQIFVTKMAAWTVHCFQYLATPAHPLPLTLCTDEELPTCYVPPSDLVCHLYPFLLQTLLLTPPPLSMGKQVIMSCHRKVTH